MFFCNTLSHFPQAKHIRNGPLMIPNGPPRWLQPVGSETMCCKKINAHVNSTFSNSKIFEREQKPDVLILMEGYCVHGRSVQHRRGVVADQCSPPCFLGSQGRLGSQQVHKVKAGAPNPKAYSGSGPVGRPSVCHAFLEKNASTTPWSRWRPTAWRCTLQLN